MARTMTQEEARRNRELMMRIAREPEYHCCCFRLSRNDRRRAKRVFRITDRVTRGWETERDRTGATQASSPR